MFTKWFGWFGGWFQKSNKREREKKIERQRHLAQFKKGAQFRGHQRPRQTQKKIQH